MRALRILLVDDDANIRAALAETLEGLGHCVCATVDTETAAVAAAEQCRPDLLIVDLALATGSGVAAVARIVQAGHVPHLFMSGVQPDHWSELQPILLKPFREADLVLSIEAALNPSHRSTGTLQA